MLTPDMERLVAVELPLAFDGLEAKRKIVLPSRVRSFLSDLVRESLLFRTAEWQRRTGLDARSPDYTSKVAHEVSYIVIKCLDGAASLKQYDSQEVSLISVVEWVKTNWCGIYPLCR